MKTLAWIACVLAVPALLAAAFAAPVAAPTSGPSIEGSYVLEYRELPDGKKVSAPEVMGMITFTKDRRNFNVYWQENGKPSSISAICRYTLTDKEYTEESTYYMMNDAAAGKGPTYETSPASGKAVVTVKGDQISFKLPLHDEPELVFTKTGFTATRAGAFVDHWKKID